MEIVREQMRTERLKTCQACRFCLAQNNRLSSIFATHQDPNGPRGAPPLSMQIMSCVGIEVYREDGMPGMICENCRVLMSFCYQFKQMCNSADTQLKTFVSTGVWPKKLAIANELQGLLTNLKQTSSPVQTKKSPQAAVKLVQAKQPEPVPIAEQEKKQNIIKLNAANLKTFMQAQKNLPVTPRPTLPPTEKGNVSPSVTAPLMTSTPIVKREPSVGAAAQIRAGIEVLKANGTQTKPTQLQKQSGQEKPPIILNNLVITSAAPKVAEEFISTGDGTVEMVLSYEPAGNGGSALVVVEPTAEPAEPTEVAKGEKVFPCGDCSRTYALKQLLDIHQLIHKRERNHPCDQCDKRFLTKYDLAKHNVTHTGDRPYVCVICRASFSRSTLLTRHQAKHKDEQKFICTVCSRQFLSSEELTKHAEIHHKNRPFGCAYCPKRFAYKQGLERHEIVHQGKLPFQCEYCEESFLTSGKLSRHLTKHAGDRPYPCRMCNKSFLLSHHLSRHLRRHGGAEAQHQYQCNACGAIFDQMEGYVRHSQEHAKHNGQCPLCDEHVGDAQSIAEHMKTHNTDRYSCDYCDLMFTSEQKLNDHCHKVHRDELAYERPEQEEADDDDEEQERSVEAVKKSVNNPEPEAVQFEQMDLEGNGLIVNYDDLQEEELIDDGVFLEDESTLVPDPLHDGDMFEITEIEVRPASPVDTKPPTLPATTTTTAAAAASPPSDKTASKPAATTTTVVAPPATKTQATKPPAKANEQTKTPRLQRMQEFFKRNQLAAEKRKEIAQQQATVSDVLKNLPKGVTVKPRASTVLPQIKAEPDEPKLKASESVPTVAAAAPKPSTNAPVVKRPPGRPPKVVPQPVVQKESAPAASNAAPVKKDDSKPKPKPANQPPSKPAANKGLPVETKELKRSASAIVISRPRSIPMMPEEQENATTKLAGSKAKADKLDPPPPAGPSSSWMIKRSYGQKGSTGTTAAAQGKKRPAEPDTEVPVAPSKRPALSRKTLNPSMLRQAGTGGKQTEPTTGTGGSGAATAAAAAAAGGGNLKRIPKSIGTPMEMSVGGRTIKVQKISKEQAIALSGQMKSKTVG